MGNALGKISVCFSIDYYPHDGHPRRRRHRHDLAVVLSEPLDEGLGHSFCYVRPDSSKVLSSKVHHSDEPPAFRSISGASVSANTATLLSTELYTAGLDRSSSAAFESSNSFASIPLQPVPRWGAGNYSGPIATGAGAGAGAGAFSGPMERGFMSGPIERGFLSGPLDRGGIFSGPLAAEPANEQFRRSFSHVGFGFHNFRRFPVKASMIRGIRKAIYKTVMFRGGQNSVVAPVKGPILAKEFDWAAARIGPENLTVSSATNLSSDLSLDEDDSLENQNLQWAQGKAGEDRVHVVVSEEHGWVFVGIYDGFNGPDAPDFLLSNLYPAIHRELKGLLWEDKVEKQSSSLVVEVEQEQAPDRPISDESPTINNRPPHCWVEAENYPFESSQASTSGSFDAKRSNRSGKKSKSRFINAAKRWEENQRKWKSEWERERLELERKLKEQLSRSGSDSAVNHSDVLKALSQALRKTEETFLDIADNMVMDNPELSLMGSCVLVMLMKGDDVYLLNVGDSRAVVAQKADLDVWGSLGKDVQDLERINEETLNDLEVSDAEQSGISPPSLCALQLSVDHSTSVEEEVHRILQEHPDDASAITNDRVKGSLKVTRAFGAGFLKKPKWNNALLEMFRIDYVGTAPYISCCPSLYHHRLGPKDRFLILSSDGLYQYFTNEEAVAEVETFIKTSPEGDPAQHLVEELIFRAAKEAGMDFHELLEIPQGDRRRYHDDVSIIVISLEGRIWRSCA